MIMMVGYELFRKPHGPWDWLYYPRARWQKERTPPRSGYGLLGWLYPTLHFMDLSPALARPADNDAESATPLLDPTGNDDDDDRGNGAGGTSSPLYSSPSAQLLSMAGMDAFLMVRYIRMCSKLAFVATVTACILVPVFR